MTFFEAILAKFLAVISGIILVVTGSADMSNASRVDVRTQTEVVSQETKRTALGEGNQNNKAQEEKISVKEEVKKVSETKIPDQGFSKTQPITQSTKTETKIEQGTAKTETPPSSPIFSEFNVPANLVLPMTLTDMFRDTEGILTPFGIVRHGRDQPHIGHGGIDMPLPHGAPLYAVADGLIQSYEIKDEDGGYYLGLLLAEGTRPGEGWRFLYEHVELVPDLAVGSMVKKGQLIARNALLSRYRNSHLGLEYLFNNYQYVKNHQCWPDRLQESDKKNLQEKFNQLAATPAFIDQWMNAAEEGKYQYRELLNTSKFPNGPQLCYPPGTDARVNQ